MILTLSLFLTMAIAVAFMARQLIKLTTAEGQLSMEKVTRRKYDLLRWINDCAAKADPEEESIFIAKRDVPLFEELAAEGRFVVVNGYWRNLRVNVAPVDLEKGQPCTRVERSDWNGYRHAIPWMGRNGNSMMHAPIN